MNESTVWHHAGGARRDFGDNDWTASVVPQVRSGRDRWQRRISGVAKLIVDLAWHGMAWHGMAWHGLAWLGLAWLGLAWLGLAWLGLAWLPVAEPIAPSAMGVHPHF